MGRIQSFGQKLKLLRKENNKTQQQVAREISFQYPNFDMSQANISHLENRETAPREEILEILADFFGVPTTYFFQSDDSSYEEKKPQIENYIQSLRKRAISEGSIMAHTDDNSSGDDDVIDTLHNLDRWYSNSEIPEE